MFFKKNYFVEFKYKGAEGTVACSTTIRCIPSMVPKIPSELKKNLKAMGYKANEIFITSIKRV